MKKLLVLLTIILAVGFGIFLGNTGVNITPILKNINISTLDVSPSAGAPQTAAPAVQSKPNAPEATSNEAKDMTEIAKLNDSPIYKWEAQAVITDLMAAQNLQNRPYENLKEDEKLAIVKEIATKKILQKQIDDSKIADEKAVKNTLKLITNNFLQSEFLNRKVKPSITSENIKAHYDETIKQIENKDELRMSNILVEKEDEANKIYQELLKKPDSFAEIAKTKSKDSSGANGGDTGYALQGSFVKEIEEAANLLKKGEISKPIKTPLGWNIIRLEDRRKTTIAPLENIKDKVAQELAQQNTQKYLKTLLDGVKLEMIDAPNLQDPPEKVAK